LAKEEIGRMLLFLVAAVRRMGFYSLSQRMPLAEARNIVHSNVSPIFLGSSPLAQLKTKKLRMKITLAVS
jgi:hypothetical protein